MLSQRFCTTTPRVTVNQELKLSTTRLVLSWLAWQKLFGVVVQRLRLKLAILELTLTKNAEIE